MVIVFSALSASRSVVVPSDIRLLRSLTCVLASLPFAISCHLFRAQQSTSFFVAALRRRYASHVHLLDLLLSPCHHRRLGVRFSCDVHINRVLSLYICLLSSHVQSFSISTSTRPSFSLRIREVKVFSFFLFSLFPHLSLSHPT